MLKMNALCADSVRPSVRPSLCDLLSVVITCVVTRGMGILYDEQSTEPESHDKLMRQSQPNFLKHCPHFLTDLREIPYRNLHTTPSSIYAQIYSPKQNGNDGSVCVCVCV